MIFLLEYHSPTTAMTATGLTLETDSVEFSHPRRRFLSLPTIVVPPALLQSIPTTVAKSPSFSKLKKQLQRLDSSSEEEEDTASKPWLEVLTRSPTNRPGSPEGSCSSSNRRASCSQLASSPCSPSRRRSHRAGSEATIYSAGQIEV